MGTRLYVGNLPYSTDEAQLRSLFRDGEEVRCVTQVKIVLDRETVRPRGFAFVELSEAQHARASIEALHSSQFGGRTLVVNEAREPQRPAAGSPGASHRPRNGVTGGSHHAGG